MKDPRSVKRKPERAAEQQTHDVRRNVVSENTRESENVVRDDQASDGNHHAADADGRKLDCFSHGRPPPFEPKSPVPAPEPVHRDGHGCRDDFRDHGSLRDRFRCEDGEPQGVEQGDVDDEPDESHRAESGELGQQGAHRSSRGAGVGKNRQESSAV